MNRSTVDSIEEHISEISQHVISIERSMQALTDVLMSPSAELFHNHGAELLRLLRTVDRTENLHAAFAYAAHEAGASRTVGSVRTSVYLARVLDVSEYQARQWVTMGMRLFGDPSPVSFSGVDATTDPQPSCSQGGTGDPGVGGEGDVHLAGEGLLEKRRMDELAERRRLHEERQRQLNAQAQARKRIQRLNNAKLAEINRELEHLEPSLRAEHHQPLLARATEKAESTSVEDLKIWLRSEIRTLNSTVIDPLADMRARKVVWSGPDKFGNVRLTAVLPRMGHALLECLMAPARLVAWDRKRGVDVDNDRRTLPQRRADALLAMLSKWEEMGDAAMAPSGKGLASLVVAVSAKDLSSLPRVDSTAVGGSARGSGGSGGSGSGGSGPSGCGSGGSGPSGCGSGGSGLGDLVAPPQEARLQGAPPQESVAPAMWFPTNTSAHLHPLDILRLGLAEHDLGVVLDPKTGRAVTAARVKRHASVEQKLMLVAEQLCCVYPGCNRPAVDCDVHHLTAWSHGGGTVIENLALLCRKHHRMNRDQHDGALGMGHAEVDPESGRVGWREARNDTLPSLPGAPPPGSGSVDGGTSKLSEVVVVNQSVSAMESPGARVVQQPWGSAEVQTLF